MVQMNVRNSELEISGLPGRTLHIHPSLKGIIIITTNACLIDLPSCESHQKSNRVNLAHQ